MYDAEYICLPDTRVDDLCNWVTTMREEVQKEGRKALADLVSGVGERAISGEMPTSRGQGSEVRETPMSGVQASGVKEMPTSGGQGS